MVLELLHEQVRDGIGKRGFSQLSPAQEQAIPLILEEKNLVLIAPTGTGKTESAMFPVFDALLKMPPGGGFEGTVSVTPLRSLNRDILARMEWWCRELGLTVGVRHGDTPLNERRKQALSPPDLLITTPETLQAIFMGKRLRQHLKHVRFVIMTKSTRWPQASGAHELAVALERIVEYRGNSGASGFRRPSATQEIIARFPVWYTFLRDRAGSGGKTTGYFRQFRRR